MPEANTPFAGSSLIPIDLGSNRKGAVRVPADVMDYFNIAKPTATAEEMITRTRKSYSRSSYKGLGDTSSTVVAVKASTWKTPVRAPKGVSGKKIIIPTELKTDKGHLRMTTLHFPSNATVGAISNWLFEKLVSHKPTYFIHNTNQYAVLKATGDVNPGESAAPPPAAG